ASDVYKRQEFYNVVAFMRWMQKTHNAGCVA
ncbi:hypothetical protein PA598K_07297, partial [Paenibacillus sp. 598K]